MNVRLLPIANPRKEYQWRAENSLLRSVHGTENTLMQHGLGPVDTLSVLKQLGLEGHGVIISTKKQTINFSITKNADVSLPSLLPSPKPATDRS